MNIVLVLAVFLWSLRIILNLLSFINLWFVKEYRLDRMLIHLRTEQGKKILFLPWRRPPASLKTICLFILSLISLMLIFVTLNFAILLKLLIIDLLAFPISGFWVIILTIPTFIYHEIIIYLAVKKLNQHAPMQVIGITGSYGKTSTKEFLATLLSAKYKVIKTAASKNSAIGIAETILNNLLPEHEVMVIEMGAYKRGEIKRMAQITQPEIGIITGINYQHQDLFGTLETTKKAKFELIEGLKGKKIGVFNADNINTFYLAAQAKEKNTEVWLYSLNRDKALNSSYQLVFADNITADKTSVSFTLHYKNQKIKIFAPVSGRHQIANILAAVCVCLILGMDLVTIAKTATRLKNYQKTMEITKGVNGAIFVNDTFNNNPDAAKAAIDYLGQNKHLKILVFQPMIELGKYAEPSHKEIGAYAAKYCDLIYLTNSNFSKSFIQGVKSVTDAEKVRILPIAKIAEEIKNKVTKKDMVLFKGKESENVLKLLD